MPDSTQRIVLASNNKGKISEFNRLLQDYDTEVIPQGTLGIEAGPENGLTFLENALAKARHASHMSGLPALADDSGLVVPALQGAPGIYSARYSGDGASDEDNYRALLNAMQDLTGPQRQAHFHCTLVFLRHAKDPDPLVCQGRWFGTILTEPQGVNGFGYDPIFQGHESQSSAAELSPSEKSRVSHRGQATRTLVEQYQDVHSQAL